MSPIAQDHALHPRNNGPLWNYNGHARITGPCGTMMEFWVAVEQDKIKRSSFSTDGCGPSLASGSMATCLVQDKRVEDAVFVQAKDLLEALGGLPKEHEHCALLAANTLKAACEDWLDRNRRHEKNKTGEPSCDTCGEKECAAKSPRPDESKKDFEERRQLQARLCRIRRKVVVLSGKGGVGKSTVAVNLATALMLLGKRVGLMDVDIHGPSIPTMLGLEGEMIQSGEDGMLPVELGGMKVMSIGFLLPHPNEAVIWRGPMKMAVIKQFLKDVDWGDLDFLIIDSPPGTGDEPLSVCQLIGKMDGAVVVTTPQKVAAVDVRKSITFCQRLQVPVIGVIENMSGFACPACGEVTPVFRTGGGRSIAQDMQVPFLGAIPMDPQITEACDEGRAFIHQYASTATAQCMERIIRPIIDLDAVVEKNT
ncbi:P-loop NTPase [candidate division FCPU426 bacterium]|nr:P-loop NTPase [candidate division FCPU426 bacterium]